MLRILPNEYRNRLEALQSRVRQAELDVFVVSSSDSLYYLTGASFEPLERPFFLLVWPSDPPRLIVPKLEELHIREDSRLPVAGIDTYWDYPSPAPRRWVDRLEARLGDAQQVGIEPTLPQEIAEQLDAYTKRMMPLVEDLRLVKSTTEIEMIRRAAQYADFAVERLLSASYFGATVAEGFAETRTVTSRIVREVDDWQPLATKVTMATWAAPRSAMPHSIPALADQLCEGPHVALALTRVNGYAAECERTYFTATPSAKMHQMFEAMTEARKIAFRMIRPGLPCAELDAALNEYLRQEGHGDEDLSLHRTGHGFGLGNHEPPWIAEGSLDRLAENMVISVEPGIYLEGFGGVRHSDTVRVTKNGYELLTKHPANLDRLVIRGWKPHARLKGKLVSRALQLGRRGAA